LLQRADSHASAAALSPRPLGNCLEFSQALVLGGLVCINTNKS
jgi:hypothetical protein